MPSKVQVITLGCSKNTVDTEHLLAQIQGNFEIVPEGLDVPVDYLLVNTCGFIGDAKEESVNAVTEAARRKLDGRVGKLIVFGCLSQRYSAELPALIPEVDGWYGARTLDGVVRALGLEPDKSLDTRRVRTSERPGTAFLKISEGCDRRCSYCAIPFIRGPHKSVPIEDLVREAAFLASDGVHELVLIAQDTTYYGLDLYKKRSLATLIDRLSEIEGIEWIRIHYSYPTDFPEDVLDRMAHNPKVCRYLDIPLQHVSDTVLSNMHRHIDSAGTRNIIKKLREKVPGVALRTTMIVGHPGEQRKDFLELMDFVAESRFERLGAFKYSEEEGTYGARHLRDSVAPSTKQRRLQALMELQSGISLEFNKSRVGSEVKVLVDSFSDGVFVCRSEYESPEVDGEILVKYEPDAFALKDPNEICGSFINVRITAADEYDLIADPIS